MTEVLPAGIGQQLGAAFDGALDGTLTERVRGLTWTTFQFR